MSIKQGFNLFGNDSVNKIRQNQIAAGAKASGKSGDSLRHTETENEFLLYGAESFKWQEDGRKPGKVPFGFAAIILKWMQDKGIVPDTGNRKDGKIISAETMAYLIARRIQAEGTSLYRNKQHRDIYSSVINAANLQKLYEQIGKEKSIDVLSDIVKAFK